MKFPRLYHYSWLSMLLLLATPKAKAQELNAQISISAQEIEATNRQIFENMEQTIFEFMNNTSFTGEDYLMHERIECKIRITIRDQVSTNEFSGEIQFNSSRPAFGTNYNSPMMVMRDQKFDFSFVEFQPLEFVRGTFTSNLVAVLAFYAYMAIGLDGDSFEEFGGTPYYEEAQNIVNSAQGGQFSGWEPGGGRDRNRFSFVDQMLDNRFAPLRQAIYMYHRRGLDVMSKDTDKGRAKIAESLQFLEKVHDDVMPNTPLMRFFFETKSSEIISVFSEGNPREKTQVLNVLTKVDMRNVSKYQEKIK